MRPGLRAWMAVTLAALLVGNVAFVVVLALVLGPWLRPVRAAFPGAVPLGPTGATALWWALLLVSLSLAVGWAQLRFTRRHTLAAVDARPASREDYPDLHARLDRLAHLADCSRPGLAVVDPPVPNSFTVGTVGTATVVVSEGLLDTLPDAERDAVLAYELAHVANRDATVMTLASFLPALTNGEYRPLADVFGTWGRRIALLGGGLLAGTLLSALVLPRAGGVGRIVSVVGLALVTYVLGAVALGVLTATVAVLARSLSRYREFAANRAGAALTGDPAALAAALQRLDDAGHTPATDKRVAYEGVRGLCLLPHGFETDTDRSTLHVETRSHPPVADRIARLESIGTDPEPRGSDL